MNSKVKKYLASFLSLMLLMQLCVFAMPAQKAYAAVGDIYFFSASGDDNNPGTQALPMKSLTKAQSLMGPGVTINFKRGDAWYVQGQGLQVKNVSGTAAAPLVIDAYGTGAKPIIAVMDLYDGGVNWVETSTGSHIWYTLVNPAGVRRVFVSGESKAFASSINGVNAAYCYYDSAAYNLYVYSTAKPSYVETIRETSSDGALRVDSCSYVTIRNLDFRGGNTYGVTSISGWSDHVTLSYLDIKEASTRWPGMQSPSDFGYGIYVSVDEGAPTAVHEYTVIDHCDITKTWSTAENDPTYSISNGGDGIYLVKAVQHAWIHDNVIHDVGHVGINLSANSATNIGVSYNVVENNIVYNTTNYYIHGFGVQGGDGLCKYNIIRQNYFYDTTVSSHATGHDNYVYSNIMYNTVRSVEKNSMQGNALDIGPFTENGVPFDAYNNIIANNTFVGCDMGGLNIESGDGGTTPVGTGILVANNIFTSWSNGYSALKEDNTQYGAVTYSNNGIYNGSAGNDAMIRSGGKLYTLSEAETAGSQFTASGNVNAMPKFINVAQVCAPTTYGDFSNLDVKFGLKSDSPFKAAGAPVTKLTNALAAYPAAGKIPGVSYTFTDLFGNPWNSTNPSIGAIQYTANTLTDTFDYSALLAKIDAAAAVDTTFYTKATVDALLYATMQARMLTTGVASQATIDSAVAALQAAIDNLTLPPPPPGTLRPVAATTNQPNLDSSRGPNMVLDGNTGTSWFSTNYYSDPGTSYYGPSTYDDATGTDNANTFFWLKIDLGAVKWVDHVDITSVNGSAAYKIQTLLSADGNFDDALTQDPSLYDLIPYSLNFTTIPSVEPQMARYILFVGKGNTGGTKIYTTISEVKVYGQDVANLLVNPGLETGSVAPWTNAGNPGPTISSDAHSGFYAIYTPRTADWQGPAQDVTAAFNKYGEGTYYAEAWVKIPTGSDQLCFTFDSTANGQRNYDDFPDAMLVSATDGWTFLSGETEMIKRSGQSGDYSNVLFKVDGYAGVPILADDLALYRVPPSIASVASSDGAVFMSGDAPSVLTISGASFSPGIAKVYLVPQAGGADILLTGVKTTDTTTQIVIPLNSDLQTGEYQIKVAVADISSIYGSVIKIDGSTPNMVITGLSVPSGLQEGNIYGNLVITGANFAPDATVTLTPTGSGMGTAAAITAGINVSSDGKTITVPLPSTLKAGVYSVSVTSASYGATVSADPKVVIVIYAEGSEPVADPDNLLINPGLETGSVDPWTNAGNPGPTISTDAHSGLYAIYTQRTADWQGPAQDVTAVFNKYGEGTYYAEAWVKVPSGSDELCFTFDSTANGQRNFDDFPDPLILVSDSDGWVFLSGAREVIKRNGQSGAYSEVLFKVDGCAGVPILADDLVLKRVPPSFASVSSENGTTFASGEVSGNLTIDGASFSPGIAQVYLVPETGAEILLTGAKVTDTTTQIIIPLNSDLPYGSYKVKVAVADISTTYGEVTITVGNPPLPLDAVNAAATPAEMGAALANPALGLDLSAYNALSPLNQAAVNQAMLAGAPYASVAAVQAALNAAIAALTVTPPILPVPPTSTPTPTPPPGSGDQGEVLTNQYGLSLTLDPTYPYIFGDAATHTVRPDDGVSRAEIAQIFYNLSVNSDKADASGQKFSDVTAAAWYYQAVQYLGQTGTLKGYSDGSFKPNQLMTRAELASIIAGFYTTQGDKSVSFSDTSGSWAKDAIEMCASHGIIQGYGDGTFRPGQSITRAEAITMINRLLDRSVTPGTYSAADNPYVDLQPSHWAYQDIIGASK